MQQILLHFIESPIPQSLQPLTSVTEPKKHIGRPSKQLTEPELKTILKGITSQNITERKQILHKYSQQKIKHAINIFKTDFGKQGIIFRTICPIHKKQKLSYGWQGYASGVRVKCIVPGCTALNTHFEAMLYSNDVMMRTI